MEYLRFWDFAVIIYLVGWMLAFALVHDRLSKPECYRIPFAIIIALFWPLVLLMCLGLYIEGILYDLKEWILKDE
jgi:hypothetical protein